MKVYSVVELEKPNGEEKIISDNNIFSSREKALQYVHERYLSTREKVDCGCGEKIAEYSGDGWYAVEDNDGNYYEGYISEALEIDSKSPKKDMRLKLTSTITIHISDIDWGEKHPKRLPKSTTRTFTGKELRDGGALMKTKNGGYMIEEFLLYMFIEGFLEMNYNHEAYGFKIELKGIDKVK